MGQEATVTVDAYPESMMNGTVQRVATKGVVTSNVVTFEVKVEVTSRRKNLLKPEMTANVSITTVDKPDALLLPVEVVNRRGPKTFVLLSGEGGKPTEQEVKIGDSDGENIEIIEGLQAEDEVFYPDSKGADSWSNDREAARNQRRNERMQRRVIRGG